MKTTRSPFRCPVFHFMVCFLAVAFELARPTNSLAITDNVITIKEFSATALTATESIGHAALTVTKVGADIWGVQLNHAINFTAGANFTYYLEPLPDPANTENKLIWGNTSISVFSDVGFDKGQTITPNINGALVNIGIDQINGDTVSIRFYDLAAHSPKGHDISDGGATACLLLLSSVLLFGLARLRPRVFP